MSVPKIKNNIVEALSSGAIVSPPIIHSDKVSFSGQGVVQNQQPV